MYNKDTIYVIGNSRTNSNNPITHTFMIFFIGFVVDEKSGTIIDVGCSATLKTTEEFIRSLFIDKNISEYSFELEEEIKRRYHGSSQKAIIVAYKDAVKKYKEQREKYK